MPLSHALRSGSIAAGLALLLALGALACGGADGAGVDAGPPEAQLGTGELAFEALTEGQELDVIRGPQGGLHVLGSVRVRGVDPGDPDDLAAPNNPTTSFRLFDGATRVDLDASTYHQGLDPAPGGGHEMLGRLVILNTMVEADVVGRTLRFEVEVEDSGGARATATRTILARRHPSNP